MADGNGTKEHKRSVTNRNSWTSDDVHRELGEKQSVLRIKSLMPVLDQANIHQLTIVTSDMADDMQEFAIECGTKALTRDKFINERDVASYIRMEMEEKYTPNWHCIVGRTFGSFVSHESKHYIHFSVGEIGILVFKSG